MIYHITTEAAWAEARRHGVYRADSLATQGFIHCSTADQVVRVANFIFRGESGLVLLHVQPERLTSEIVYENLEGGDELFPHVYGPIDVGSVTNVTPFAPDADGGFTHHDGTLGAG